MISEWINTSVLVSIGGNFPGVDAFDPINDCQERALSFPAGQSVYAVDVSSDGMNWAAGTRGGHVYWLIPDKQIQDGHENPAQEFCLGAGVLSVCFMDSKNLTVSDATGKCWICQLANTQPRILPVGMGTICSLHRLDSNHLAGLSSAGELLIWNWPRTDLVQKYSIPAPPVMSALVRLIYWSQADSLVWPVRGGDIAFYQLKTGQVHTIGAHKGDFYAMGFWRDLLFTIGQTDGCLKCWESGIDEPVDIRQVPDGIVSAFAWEDGCPKILMVNDSGQAGVYEFSGGKASLIHWLSGQDYRIAFSPDMDKFKLLLDQKKSLKAREVAMQITECIRRGQTDGLDFLHEQLIQSDHRHVSLALRAEEAKYADDIVAELKSYKELAQLVSIQNEGMKDSLLRYTVLLESVWQLQIANSLYKQLSAIYPKDRVCIKEAQRLTRHLEVLELNEYVVEADVPLSILIKSADVVDRPLVGRFVMNISDPISCDINIELSEFFTRYEKMRQEEHNAPLPQADEKELYWLSSKDIEPTNVIIFAVGTGSSLEGLELGIKILKGACQTILTPVVLFNTTPMDKGISSVEHNQLVLERLKAVENQPLARARLEAVYNRINHVIRQLITRQSATGRCC